MKQRVYLIDNDDSELTIQLVESLLQARHFVGVTRNTHCSEQWLKEYPKHFHSFACVDITDNLFSVVLNKMVQYTGRIDALICLYEEASYAAFEEIDRKQFQQLMSRNFFSVTGLVRSVLPFMREQGEGRVVNVSSASSLLAERFLSDDTASQFALNGLFESLSKEVEPFNIHFTNLSIAGLNPRVSVHGAQNANIADYQRAKSAWRLQRIEDQPSVDMASVVTDLCTLLNCKNPPLHLLFGQQAYYLLESRLTKLMNNIEHGHKQFLSAI